MWDLRGGDGKGNKCWQSLNGYKLAAGVNRCACNVLSFFLLLLVFVFRAVGDRFMSPKGGGSVGGSSDSCMLGSSQRSREFINVSKSVMHCGL